MGTHPGRAAVGFELTGVLVVGTLTVLDAAAFPDDTVSSFYGRGYGSVPLVLRSSVSGGCTAPAVARLMCISPRNNPPRCDAAHGAG